MGATSMTTCTRRFIAIFICAFAASWTTASFAQQPADTVGVVKSSQFVAPKNQPGKSGYLPLKPLRGELNLCVPTSAAAILQRFGSRVTPREIKALTKVDVYDPKSEFTDFTITYYKDLLIALTKLGITWNEKLYANDHQGFLSGLKDIQGSIDQGNPVLLDTTLFGTHTVVASGYDEAAQRLIIFDTNIPPPGIRVVPYSDVETFWNSRNVGYDGRAAIFSQPPSLATGKMATASSSKNASYKASKAVDADVQSRWAAAPESRDGWLEVDLGQSTTVGRAVIKELAYPNIQQFTIEYKVGGAWTEIASGTTIAGTKVLQFEPVSAQIFRLNVLKAKDAPSVEEFELHPPLAAKTE